MNKLLINMKSTKFYYSKATYKVMMEAWTDDNGNVIFIPDKIMPGKLEKLHRITVASVYDKKNNTLSFGVAICSPRDLFSKKIGRELAYSRAISNPAKKVILTSKSNIKDLSIGYANELIDKYTKLYV